MKDLKILFFGGYTVTPHPQPPPFYNCNYFQPKLNNVKKENT